MYKISLDKIDLLFDRLASDNKVYLPVDDKAGATFKQWEKGTIWSNALNTTRSPKDFFFPQIENLMEFKTQGKNIEVIDTREEYEDFIIFGIRSCDVKSFDVLDNVFLSEPVDSYYAHRREHGIIFSLACSKPSETCFCKTFDIDPANPQGDVSMWKTADELYLQPNTEKGSALLNKCSDVLENASGEEVDNQKQKINNIMKKLPLKNLTTEGFGVGKTQDLFDLPEWEELSEACLGCGTCTFVCPTCQCYDIKDFDKGNGVVRFRCWDSCMYSDFTKMAHGNNRNTQTERFRQRFMHKLVYFPENNDGLFSCVGCGRCLAKCPISMNIVKVMKKIGGIKGE